MTSNLSYLLATQRMADLAQSAEQARRNKDATEPPSEQRSSPAARTLIRLRLRGTGGRRLRVRRA
jgi:hypothetical protein